MINNWKHFNLQPNFSNIQCSNGQPSDLDMFYLTQDKFLIIGEFKNGDMGKLGDKQKELFETFIDNYKNGGIIIYATHHETIEKGATNYDSANCKVEQYYYNGKWHKPKKYTIVQDVFDKYDKEIIMNIESDKERKIFRNDNEKGTFYSIGLSKKDRDGNFINGYINCRFPKNTELPNNTKIKIVQAWLDFYVKERITYPYIFINKFELVEDVQVPQNVKTEYEQPEIKLDDKDLPF